ncbi:MAG: hypothetical protein RI918_2462, partial [Pseudomonadota bacterium]
MPKLVNFALPAIAMGVMVPLFSRLIWRKTPVKRPLKSQMLTTSLACLGVLFAGLVILVVSGLAGVICHRYSGYPNTRWLCPSAARQPGGLVNKLLIMLPTSYFGHGLPGFLASHSAR